MPKITPISQSEFDAVLELLPVASDYSLHGDDRAEVALRFLRFLQDEYKKQQDENA